MLSYSFAFLLIATASAQAPSLGSAAGFAVLGASTVTNAGMGSITGNVGVAPGTAISGFLPGSVHGAFYAGGPVALQAQADVTAAYNALVGAVCGTNLTGQDLGGRSLTPGVYCYSSSAQLTGTLTLDGLGDSSSVFRFQIGSTLTTAVAASVQLINGANARNVFWQVGSSATLGTATVFAGNVLAFASITLENGASLSGRALARTAAVTLDNNSVGLPPTAAWHNYGVGWPGTAGIPALVLSALPVLGTSPSVVVENVRGPATFGLFVWGTGPVNIPTQYGGAFQVQQVFGWSMPIGPGLHAMSMPIPLDYQLSGVTFDVQILQFDAGASHFVAFTRGLHMVLGR